MTIDARFQLARGGFSLDVDFQAPARGVTAVFGPTGCGKTTLLRLIAGLERDPNGRVAVAGDLWQDGARFTPSHRRAVGYVPQDAGLFPHLSVRGNLEFGYRRIAQRDRRMAFDEVTNLLELYSLLDRRPATLSGGERQRVAIGRALLTSPSILLLDEPLSALDARRKAEILPYLDRLHDALEIPVLYVTHAIDEVAQLADFIVLMDTGRITTSGPALQLMSRLDTPLAETADAEAILEGRVESHDEQYNLTRVTTDGGAFTVARTDLPLGQRVRLRIRARDVSITLAHQSLTSILNILSAKVVEMSDAPSAQVTVRLALSPDAAILARITRKSADNLALEHGKRVFAQIKTVALVA